MKSLMMLWRKLAEESASRCCTCATMDVKTVHRRFEHEGLSFLTITLPAYGKAIEKWLDQGQVDRISSTSFRWRGGLPVFLRGFLGLVFDRSSGVLLDDPNIDAILALRQLTLMFGKIALPCSDARERRAIAGFIKCEQDVRINDAQRRPADLADFQRISSLLFANLFTKVDSDIYYGRVIPKHGPGSTADGLKGNSKLRLKTWTARMEKVFPSGEFLLPSWSFYDQLDEVDILDPGSETPAKVVTVPKTLKTPRVIAMEPTAMQYAQQGIYESILNHLRWDDYPLKKRPSKSSLRRIIGINDQPVNNRMARDGSLYGDLATLDLSEASDRVSNQLVREMMRNHPHLHEGVDACRSRKADVPSSDGVTTIRLAKFASMGSALCFPIEAMVFTTLIFIGIERELGTPLDQRAVKQFSDKVRVYGDDIIIPVDYVRSVVQVLQAFGLVVNLDKSFWTGRFRESCGKEYYAGEDVSIVRVRKPFPTQRKHADRIISIVSLRNQLYKAGYWSTCQWLDSYIKGVIRHFPVVLETSPVLGRHSFLGYNAERTGVDLHNPLVKGYVESSRIPSDPLEGPGALLKFHLKRGDEPTFDDRHLERAGRPHAVNIKLRWASAV